MLIQITAPTASGRTVLLNHLVHSYFSGVDFINVSEFEEALLAREDVDAVVYEGVLLEEHELEALRFVYNTVRKSKPGFILIIANQI